ncbi:hypothetical protein [Arsenicibacter rosenii]|uniref:hypothetical protein n=1 Tax=Arsenicibacter rosenii TaxID=1750698 RepID=UPI0015A5262A|nr:hypothetical protein [Arsenicibacter rosenii]
MNATETATLKVFGVMLTKPQAIRFQNFVASAGIDMKKLTSAQRTQTVKNWLATQPK